MNSGFPHMMSGAKPSIRDNKLNFTYIDSYGEVIDDIRPILSPTQIRRKVMARMRRFEDAGPGSRESEISRAERKWISAHPRQLLKVAWNLLDEHSKMEMSMMLSEYSHYGISSPSWARRHARERHEIIGDNMTDL